MRYDLLYDNLIRIDNTAWHNGSGAPRRISVHVGTHVPRDARVYFHLQNVNICMREGGYKKKTTTKRGGREREVITINSPSTLPIYCVIRRLLLRVSNLDKDSTVLEWVQKFITKTEES